MVAGFMDYPLEPIRGETDPDVLMGRFLAYVEGTGLELYPAQLEAILEVFGGKNIILNTPTGSGKSLVAAAMHFYSASMGRKSVYTCPIKALVNEKFLSLCRTFGPENVGMMTGDASVNQDAPILCCTAEILANIALRDGEKGRVHDVIMDEFHYYSDRERGVAWQAPLLTLPQCRFLLISATLGDTRFFNEELLKHTGVECVTITSKDRPVPLEFTYLEEPLVEALEDLQKQNRMPVYIVHFTQRSAAETAQSLLSLNVCTKEEKREIKNQIQDIKFTSPFGRTIRKLLMSGIGLHHAGLLPKYRVLVEQLAQKGMLKLICGTDTLGVGVNVPIRTVLFTQLCKFGGDKTAILSARDFHQVSGRAGRKGFDDIGYVVALAPAHVIENKRKEAKAGGDPKKLRKIVKSKAPTRGFVPWDEDTYLKLQKADPEPLELSFDVSHGMLLNVLSREGDGCGAMRKLIRDCHEPESKKPKLRSRAFQLFRALVERDIIEINPERGAEQKLRVNVDLQDEFSLNQTLSLWCVDTLALLDMEALDYPLRVISLAEAILENPKAILMKQVDKLKDDLVAEMKAAGVEYDERMEKLDTVEHPKPDAEFIYETFNAFADKHPWVGAENIRPKSIAREMFERYSSFADYIKRYGLGRSEGLMLRHLSQVFRVLENTVPPEYKNEALKEAITYFEHLLRQVDSSLLDEWERMRNPEYRPEELSEVPEQEGEDITRSKSNFTRLVRNEVFSFVRMLATKQYETLAESYELDAIWEDPEAVRYADIAMEKLMEPFYESRQWIRLDPAARAIGNTRIEESEDRMFWTVSQTLVDDAELNDWEVVFTVDLVASSEANAVQFKLEKVGEMDG